MLWHFLAVFSLNSHTLYMSHICIFCTSWLLSHYFKMKCRTKTVKSAPDPWYISDAYFKSICILKTMTSETKLTRISHCSSVYLSTYIIHTQTHTPAYSHSLTSASQNSYWGNFHLRVNSQNGWLMYTDENNTLAPTVFIIFVGPSPFHDV